ncbi:MAG TPA: heme exporter protein CcmD [Sutterella sp.]|nr:heme exporter protein CcmD [Sutterella sp.]
MMDFSSIAEFFHMNGHGFYVWSAYGMLVFLVLCEILTLRKRRVKIINRLIREARAVRDTLSL